MFKNALIRDYVLPLVEAKKTKEGYEFKKFHGTCFLVGSEGIALTNYHLLGTDNGNTLCVMVVNPDTTWSAFEVADSEKHPTEDVVVLKIADLKIKSFMKISSISEYSACAYMQWSYPDEIVTELLKDGAVTHRPDLIYYEGYIRRRLSGIPLDGIIGNLFYEISEAGSSGCSGSPVIKKHANASDYWQVIGIYVGSRRSQHGGDTSSVGYIVRADAIANWQPIMLNKSLKDC